MNRHLKASIITLFLLFALLGIGAVVTRAHDALASADALFLASACVFFLVSVLIWVFSWAYLLKKHTNATYPQILMAGFGSVYGSLTPIQLGADALRALHMKELHGVGYSTSLSASMATKGAKFALIAMLAAAVLSSYIAELSSNTAIALGFASGLFVIIAAAFLFLCPALHGVGPRIASAARSLSRRFPRLSRFSSFFEAYSSYIAALPARKFAAAFALVGASWLFEFLALYFSFLSFGISIPLQPLLVLMVIVSVLERTPFLPRGIGLVELAGYNFLAFPELASVQMSVAQIGAVLIAYDVARLVVPTAFSIAVSALFLKQPKDSKH